MERIKKYRFLNHLWDQESGLSGMLILLFVMHFVLIPMFGSFSFFLVVLNIFWMLFLMAGIFALSKSRKQAVLISIVPVLFIVFGWISAFNPTPFTILTDLIISISTFLLLIVLVLLKVFEPGPITSYRVIGSVVVYMLMANIWAIVYQFFYLHIEGSFQVTLPPFESNSLDANFMYFSYITITTTGFGEIVPLHPMARALVQVEAFIGVLYPVILIGRLVSDANSGSQKEN
ncbi:Ion channel [Flavobacterium fluvii]|uniref:Ion channel n=1 Tax=Flavobacterium fluvii TaxID=468056 RepID=A0A1M5M8F1_9FLAO|nr:potassium channel family protein [Flavobacterium fluvii]SHG73093.1 Ion channel [Flavobacterium fluvii]